jgi:hypothetical protein
VINVAGSVDLQQSHALQAQVGKLWARLAKEARCGDFTSKHLLFRNISYT